MPLDKIYRHQRVPFLALVLVVTRVRSSTLPHLFPDLNPISLLRSAQFYMHLLQHHLLTVFLAVNVVNFTSGEMGRCLSNRFAEHLRSVRNNDVDKPVAQHFNTINHSISDIKVCAISSISAGGRKRRKKRLISKIGTIHLHRLNQRFSFI